MAQRNYWEELFQVVCTDGALFIDGELEEHPECPHEAEEVEAQGQPAIFGKDVVEAALWIGDELFKVVVKLEL